MKPDRLRGEDYGPRTYFLTFATANRRRLFQVERNVLLLIETLQRYRLCGNYLLHEFTIMPDHSHLLLTPTGVALERAVQYIKGGFSHELHERFRASGDIWQRGFTDHRIRDAGDYEKHRAYIYENAVRAGLAAAAEEFPFCSASRGDVDPNPFASAAKAASI